MIKRVLIISIVILSIIFLTCEPKVETDPFPLDLTYPFMIIKMNIKNNTDSTIDISYQTINFGPDALENTSDIFLGEGEFLYFKNESIYSVTDDVWLSSKYSPPVSYNPPDPDTLIIDKSSEYLKLSPNSSVDTYRLWAESGSYYSIAGYGIKMLGFKSFLVRLKWNNNEERILAGWPKYWYSKMPNVVKYGFCYTVAQPSFDKKIWENINKTGKRGIAYSINSDNTYDGQVTHYRRGTYYSLRVIINNPDSINIEVLPETGTEIPGYYDFILNTARGYNAKELREDPQCLTLVINYY